MVQKEGKGRRSRGEKEEEEEEQNEMMKKQKDKTDEVLNERREEWRTRKRSCMREKNRHGDDKREWED